jgi:hypothetical protein
VTSSAFSDRLTGAFAGGRAPPRHRTLDHPGDFADADRRPLADGDDNILQILNGADQTLSANQQLLTAALQVSATGHRIVLLDRLEYV